MLELKNIKKNYTTGDTTVHALKGVSVQFRDSEFVAVLGQSGCGKTTLLNIIGGLDHYTSGDLLINGTSTKKYMDRDWDSYRNHSVGFVFQSYNLIPHQSVLANVELALTLSGVSKRERRERAKAALEQVGLGDQLHKKPNQMSGGQMQRVAIARALVNDPSIVLADEPTGALDSETSVQVMEILKEISKDRLVIMVTHNPELAHQYANRIVQLKDGELVNDSNPYRIAEEEGVELARRVPIDASRTSMSLTTAFSLSLNNLFTKKGRTILTAFAGSIGIIGIALILSLSDGAQNYITETEESTMGSYPITIQETSVELTSVMSSMMGSADDDSESTSGEITSKNIVTDMVTSVADGATENDMASIKEWLDSNPDNINDYVTDIQYSYDVPLNIYKSDTSDGIVQINPSTVMEALGMASSSSTQSETTSSISSSSSSGYDVWTALLDNQDTWERDYEVLAGHMPEAWNQVVIYVDENNQISDYTLYALGLLDQDELSGLMSDVIAGNDVDDFETTSYTYDELLDLTFKLVPESSKYAKQDDGTWADMSDDDDYMAEIIDAAETIEVVGIVRPSESNTSSSNFGAVLYMSDLITHLIEEVDASDVVQAQRENSTIDIFTGYMFSTDDESELTMDDIEDMIDQMSSTQGEQMQAYIEQMRESGMSDEDIIEVFQEQLSLETSDATYEGNLEILGVADVDEPSSISIYPIDFDAKEQVEEIIEAYNQSMTDSGQDDQVIQYTDVVGLLMSSVTSIINAITYILIAFVAISLVVSSIMIGIITYISVLERTKEIGILRSIGASKKDISRVFNAETFIIGLAAGLLGIGVTVLLDIPINMIIEAVAGVEDLAAVPMGAGAILVIISVILTLIGGVIPSRMAAKKDPVTALRTE